MDRTTLRASAYACAALVAVLLACLALNWDQPLVRNGLVYARAAENLIANHFHPLAVVADSRLSYDKPIGFAWLASPLVALVGTHHGLMLASFAGTVLYLLAAWRFSRGWALADRERARLCVFAGLAPIVAYQAWSSHPDALFAALYLFAFSITQSLVRRPSIRGAVLLAATIFVSLVLKNYAMILLPSATLYFVWHRKRLLRAAGGRRTAVAIALLFALLATLVILGRTGHNPLMRIEGEGGGAGQYGQGAWLRAALGTWLAVFVALLVNLHVALFASVRARGWRATAESEGLLSAFVCFPLVYGVGLMGFPTTFYNMRYFVPLLPFVALLAVLGLRASIAPVRRIVSTAFTVVALLLVTVFDVAPVHALVEPHLPRLELDWVGVPLSLLDNLRMPMHRRQAAVLDNLNAEVGPGGVVYMLDVFYYRDAQQGVYERAGLIQKGIRTRYVGSRDFAPAEPRFYVAGSVRDPERLQKLGTVTDLGLGLYRIERSDER